MTDTTLVISPLIFTPSFATDFDLEQKSSSWYEQVDIQQDCVMHRRLNQLTAALFLSCLFQASATVHYVDLNSTNAMPPYTNWITAATNIQDAVDTANPGDIVLVTNGVYQTGGRTLYNDPPTNRVSVTKLMILMSVNGPAVTTIQGYQMPGTTNGANAVRCVFLTNGAMLAGFTLTHGATYSYAPGGAWNYGGAVFCQTTNPATAPVSDAVVSSCVLVGNSANFSHVAYGGRLQNCVLAFNAGGASYCSLNNCTVVGNSGSIGGGVHFSTAVNCIIFSNTASTGPNSWSSTLAYCCIPDAGGTGHITNAPNFIDLIGGDFHLQSNSPCINAGNNAYVSTSTDLEGSPRIKGGTVDIGAYEFQNPASVISYAWLQQYGLPTDGSADFIDTDHDGMNNWQEWIAGTDPTNPLSVLKMLAPSNNVSGITVKWQSVLGINYYLRRGTNLHPHPTFASIQSNVIGQAGTTSFTDTTTSNSGPYFFRVVVQQ